MTGSEKGGAQYTTIVWHCISRKEFDQREMGERCVSEMLAAGWQLHGGPIALPGERVLQALVKPAAEPAARNLPLPADVQDTSIDGVLALLRDGYAIVCTNEQSDLLKLLDGRLKP